VLQLTSEEIRAAVNDALAEDVGSGDVTTLACIPADSQSTAVMTARESLLLAGLDFAVEVFLSLSPNLSVRRLAVDGHRIDPGQRVLEVSGATRPILTGERVALNFSQRLSGVATQTAAYVEAVSGTSARILDTRKTTPGWRRFEKYAVGCGGGTNHRTGLYDLVLIKDNHLAALADESPDAVAAAVTRARRLYPELKVEVEADHLGQVRQAVEAGADIILLDNMSLEDLRAAVSLVAGRAKTEASGGVTLKTVKGIAETGVDYISVGALTHSARAVDLGLDFL
jgi:nicotinate-nucleotide pyrophosphorylase (carboxylating)